jgi:hypothetical protein
MKRIPLTVCLVAATAIVLTVSACAPAVHGTSGSTLHPQSTAHPHATVKPHPKATQAAIPVVRVPVTCSALFTDSAAAALIDSPIQHHHDATTIPVDIIDIAQRQYGSLGCLWGGDVEDSGFVQYLSVDITPDAKAAFIANLSGLAHEDTPTVTNAAGDQSVSGCDGSGGGLSCNGNMIVGNYWVTAAVQDIGTTSVSSATASSRIQQVLTTVATALKNTTAAPAWNPPGAALPTFCSTDASTAQVNTALGVTDFAPVGEDEASPDAASYTQLPGVYTQCAWGTGSTTEPFTFLSVAMLKGGAWVIPELPGRLNTRTYTLGAYTPMTIPGATAAAGYCSTGVDECQVALSIGTLLVVLDMDDPSDAQSSAALAKIVADIKAS